MKKLIVATNNKSKLKEVRRIMADSDMEILSLKDVGYEGSPEENGVTFEQNALIKAQDVEKYLHQIGLQGEWYVLSDDSGLMVDALPGRLGVRTARLASDILGRVFPDEKRDEFNNSILLDLMKGKENRTAKYVVSMCLISYYGTISFHEGFCQLEILEGEIQGNGFAYDSVVKSVDWDKPMSQLTDQEKDECSHRGMALNGVKIALNMEL